MTDELLLEQLRRRDEGAIAELAARYAPLAATVAARILPGRREDTEEVAADVLVRLWQAGETLRPETLRGFVITAARNLAVDRWRQLRRRNEVPLFDGDGEATALLESDLAAADLTERIRALHPPDGELFLRHHLLLESAAEIGKRFGLTEAAVRSRLHRVRKLLQEEVVG